MPTPTVAILKDCVTSVAILCAVEMRNAIQGNDLKKESYIKEEQGWRSGESTRLPPMWPGFESWRRRHMWVEFVVGSLLVPRGFSPGTPVFPSP